MYHVNAHGVDERMINVHYYYYIIIIIDMFCLCGMLGGVEIVVVVVTVGDVAVVFAVVVVGSIACITASYTEKGSIYYNRDMLVRDCSVVDCVVSKTVYQRFTHDLVICVWSWYRRILNVCFVFS